jgi:hypothetical protein
VIQYIFPNQLGKILLFVTSYETCDVSKRQLILKSVILYFKIRKKLFICRYRVTLNWCQREKNYPEQYKIDIYSNFDFIHQINNPKITKVQLTKICRFFYQKGQLQNDLESNFCICRINF